MHEVEEGRRIVLEARADRTRERVEGFLRFVDEVEALVIVGGGREATILTSARWSK